MDNSELRRRGRHEETLRLLSTSTPAIAVDDYAEKSHLAFSAKRLSRCATYSKARYAWLAVLTLLAFVTRFWRLDHPHRVVFDEVHFGKFASFYLRGTYFFDVHPPLGKLIVAATGYAVGYDGSYLFDKIGEDYSTRNVPYITLRAVPATFGALLVPLVFAILTISGHGLPATVLGTSMVLLETAMLTQSRLILLDAFMILFDLLSVYAWMRFYSLRNEPHSRQWWKWLVITGISLALCVGIKMVGLFVILLIGLSTLNDLWRLMDVRRGLDIADVLEHFVMRAMSLAIVPFVLYMIFFAIHFAILTKTGPGDSFMTPSFQATLDDNKFNHDSEIVYYGTNVTFLHVGTNVYLHSHAHNYPLRYETERVSSQGQQVTGYGFADQNSQWSILHPENHEQQPDSLDIAAQRPVHHNDVVYLKHVATAKYLLTHDVASPLTATNQEVTCIDPVTQAARLEEALWKVEINKAKDNATLNSIDSRFKFIHVKTGVALHSHKGLYGEWGFKQQEVNGNKKATESSNDWLIHTQQASFVPELARVARNSTHPGFLAKFLELHNVMLKQNAGLTSSHPYQSTPASWPFLSRGISFWLDTDSKKAQIYLLGNPAVWWTASFSVLIMLCIMLVDAILLRRGVDVVDATARSGLQNSGGFFLLGWALHYLPFFVMGRALFLHHYLPALMFSILVAANVFDFSVRRLHPTVQWTIATALTITFAVCFYLFAPFAYGSELEPEQITARKWLSRWDFQYAG